MRGQLEAYYNRNVPPSFGEGSSSILPTDLSNQYIVLLIEEIYKDTGRKNMVSEGIFTDGTDESLRKQASLLAGAYLKAAKHAGVEGVYTVWTAGEFAKTSAAHQNWLYFDFGRQKIIRLEPNGPAQDRSWAGFRMGEFMDLLVRKASESTGKIITWEFALSGVNINNFDGCRATSTILATMHVLGIGFEEIKKIDNTAEQPNSIKALVYILQKNIAGCKIRGASSRKTRATSKELNLISPF